MGRECMGKITGIKGKRVKVGERRRKGIECGSRGDLREIFRWVTRARQTSSSLEGKYLV